MSIVDAQNYGKANNINFKFVPRLNQLLIKNFRSVGTSGISIFQNDIVMLTGSSTISADSLTAAYNIITGYPLPQLPLNLDDFHNSKVDKDNLPEIELHLILPENAYAPELLESKGEGEFLYREKWIWTQPGLTPCSYSYNTEYNSWVLKSLNGYNKSVDTTPAMITEMHLPLVAIMDRALSINVAQSGQSLSIANLKSKLKEW